MELTNVSHYRLLRKIGEGGMGEVYLAEDTILRRQVAVKFLSEKLTDDERSKKRLLREARAAAKLDHANICAIYEVSEDGGHSFIAMQYVEGETLACKTRGKPLEVYESIQIAVQITDALADAHSHGLVHRDIKPENVIIGPGGQVKVLDFGLAKNVKQISVNPDARTVSLLSESGAIVGTVPYMSPEQVRAEELDGRSDIFSIGTVMYEMLSGTQPFDTGNPAKSIAAILTIDPPRLRQYVPNIPADLERAVRKCLEKDKERRYQSARDLLVDLKEIERDVRPASTWKRPSKFLIAGQHGWQRARVGRWPLALLLLTATILAAAILYSLFRSTSNGGTLEPVNKITSIAILPFTNENANLDIEYLCDGLTESLIKSLSQLPNMKVIARTSVFRYKGRDIVPQDLGRELRVQALLVGRVVQRGDDFFINLELVEVDDNSRLWGAVYNRKLLDLLSTQWEMSKSLQDKLRPKLSDEQRGQLSKRYTENMEAYQLYLKGRYQWNKRTTESLNTAINYFQQAVEKDPKYALAYVGLADSYLLGSVLPPREAASKATEAALTALSIDSNLADAHASLGFAKSRYDWKWSEAQKEYQRAIELNPNYAVAYYWYADLLMVLGKHEEALTILRRAQELDPVSPTINTDLGRPLFYQRQYDRAIDQFRQALAMDQSFWTTHYCLGLAYVQKAMYTEAINEFQIAKKLSGGSPTVLGALGYAYGVSGKREKAKQVLADLNKLSSQRHVSSYFVATVYVGLGDKVMTFKSLEKAFDEREPSLILLKVAPIFDSVRSDPRFSSLTNRMNFPA